MAEKLKETGSQAKVSKPKREKRKPEKSTADGDEETTTTVHKVKREKRKREATVVEGGEESAQEPEPRKKKHKNKTGFPDPGDDPSLSEQASKALSYAFLQFRKPSKWKFSKARQNWLIRNAWSETIPDAYLALTVQYLSNVKGGVRETLIKDCKSVLSAPSHKSALSAPSEKVSPAETTSEVQPQPADVAQSSQLKHTRARALLDALETPDSPLPK